MSIETNEVPRPDALLFDLSDGIVKGEAYGGKLYSNLFFPTFHSILYDNI